MNESILCLAMGTPGQQGQGASPLGMFVPMILIFGIFYFMLIRPQQRREKERRNMIANLKSCEKVLFCGGIIGTITNVKEHTFTVKIADNVKIEILRSAVNRVLEKGEKLDEESDK